MKKFVSFLKETYGPPDGEIFVVITVIVLAIIWFLVKDMLHSVLNFMNLL